MNSIMKILESLSLFRQNRFIHDICSIAEHQRWRKNQTTTNDKEKWFKRWFGPCLASPEAKKISCICFREDSRFHFIIVDLSRAQDQVIRSISSVKSNQVDEMMKEIASCTEACLHKKIVRKADTLDLNKFTFSEGITEKIFDKQLFLFARATSQSLSFNQILRLLEPKIITSQEVKSLRSNLHEIVKIATSKTNVPKRATSPELPRNSSPKLLDSSETEKNQNDSPSNHKHHKTELLTHDSETYPNPLKAEALKSGYGVIIPKYKKFHYRRNKSQDIIIEDLFCYAEYLKDKLTEVVGVTFDAVKKEKKIINAMMREIEEDREVRQKLSQRDESIRRLTQKVNSFEKQHFKDKQQIRTLKAQLEHHEKERIKKTDSKF